MTLKTTHLVLALCLGGSCIAASAQAVANDLQRDVNQETRIRNGLQDGSLNTREAALLQREQAGLDRMESRQLRDGTMTPAEQARLTRAQNEASRDIARARHNGVSGDPMSASSQRMQQVVQRDINQQQRIVNGVQNGSLTNKEVSALERGQARNDAQQFRRARDGQMSAADARAANRAENRQSTRIYNKKHNGVARRG